MEENRPIPKPRRVLPNIAKTQYENVSIEESVQTSSNRVNLTGANNSQGLGSKDIIIKSPKDEKESVEEKSTRLDDSKTEDFSSTTSRPVPAPRRYLEIYENVKEKDQISSPPEKATKEQPLIRKAPDIPKTPPNTRVEERSRIRSTSCGESAPLNFSIKKSVSNTTLNSSVSSTSSHESQKYKSPSPTDLLKSLGTTSRLLTEAISERVAVKAKGAKHKLDKNINTWSSETSSRLKSVRKKINALNINAFTLTKQEKSNDDFDQNRPRTVPIDDEVFQSITFNSPLNKVENVTNLSKIESSYEIPKGIKLAYPCPLYDEVILKNSSGFERNTLTTKSLITHNKCEKKLFPSDKNNSDTKLNEICKSEDATSIKDCDYRDSNDSLPMPNYPPPDPPDCNIYGKLNVIEPPVRLKRRHKYESVELRESSSIPSSNRATIDLSETRDDCDLSSRNISIEIQKCVEEEEKCIQNPARSESWTYYEGNEDDSSSPEPIYENQEVTYGKLYDMKSHESEIISPLRIQENERLPSAREMKNLVNPEEILHEFDPLMAKNLRTVSSEKSNELLLLENLLQNEIYGPMSSEREDVPSSDEENENVPEESLPTPPQRMDSLEQHAGSSKEQKITENCNANKISFQENLQQSIIQSYLAKVDEVPPKNYVVDLSRPSQSKTNWFVRENSAEETVTSVNLNKIGSNTNEKCLNRSFSLDIASQAPPSYTEAMGLEDTSCPTPEPVIQTDELPRASVKSMFTNVLNKMDRFKRKTSFRGTREHQTRIVLEMIPKPTLSQRLVRHEGLLVRFPSGVVEDILKEMQNRKAVLRDRRFQTFQDQEMKNPKESFPLEHITTIQCVRNKKVTDNATHFYCFEITITISKNQNPLSNPNVVMTTNNSGNLKQQRICHLYGVGKESERDIWMQRLIESLTNVFPPSYTCQYYRAGWCYLKKSITSAWSGTWILLKKRKRRLLFYSDVDMNLEIMDLRKARCIVLKDSDDSIKNLHVEQGPLIMVDCPPYTVYLIMSCPRETKIWRQIIREVAHNNGPSLKSQQLTKYNVPVIVDKCINFIYIHGSMSEGIYRKSGSENSILKLLAQFRADAFNVEITRNEYNEHDVANVLKRFMRDLPQRLLGKYSASFISITALTSVRERISPYKELLSRLPQVEYETLKKLLGHLAFIQSLKSKNKMDTQNLAMIWGPTLLQNTDDEMTYSQKEADVIADLITLYKNLYHLSVDEIKKEQEMLQCLKRYYAASETLSDPIKQSGDLKVWITVDTDPDNTLEEQNQINVTLTPTKTAYDVCKELSSKAKMPVHKLTLHEVILNGTLDRPLHHDEKVFDVVLGWSYWPEVDRKNNHLVLRPLDILKEIQRALRNLATVTPGKELKFADSKTKTFKSLQVELRDGRILITKKEKNVPVLVREIPLKSVIAYLGCEKKREFQWGWAITFIEKERNNVLRSRDVPYIGHVIGGNIWEDRIIWFSSIWNCLYGDNIMPPSEIIIK